MNAQVYFGRILPQYLLRTSEGDYFLSAASADCSTEEAKASPFPAAREREDQFVVVKGKAVDDSLRESVLVEVVPPMTSQVLSRLIDERSGVRNQILSIARDVRDELVGAPAPVSPKEAPLEVVPSGPLPLVVVEIGHSPSAQGAEGILNGSLVKEYTYNKDLAERIERHVRNARVVMISRDPEGLAKLPAKTNALRPNFVISLHANSDGASGRARGSEVLYYHTSTNGKKLASILQKEFQRVLGNPNRGIKPRTSADRGGSQLAHTSAPIVIGEPFFINNKADLALAITKRDELAKAYAKAIDEYAAGLSLPKPSPISNRTSPSAVEQGTTYTFAADNLTKEKFLTQNRTALEALVAAINQKLAADYGINYCPLTREDVWVLTYIEAGLRNGKVDPDHRHSLGERGLLPLPANIKFWNGPGAPEPNKPMPLARNLEHFYLYLGNLKNRNVSGAPRYYYRDLFRLDGIASHPARGAKLLAAVVHGYFYGPNYRPGPVPHDHLVNCCQNGTPLATMMGATKYVHAGSPIISGREANINAAVKLL
jgi:N-acetylmuramoyl-L-alanine amidase